MARTVGTVSAGSIDSYAPDHRKFSMSPRLLYVASVCVFFFAYLYGYFEFLLPWQEYWGFSSRRLDGAVWVFLFVIAVLPATVLPVVLKRPSQVLLQFQYLAIYLPAVIVIPMAGMPRLPLDQALWTLVALLLAQLLMSVAYLLPLLRLPKPKLLPFDYWLGVLTAGLGLLLIVVVTLGGNFRAVGLDQIYAVRTDAVALLQNGNPFAWYAQLWLAGAVLPLLFAGLAAARRWALLVPVVVVYLLLFGLTGTKSTLLAAVILFALVIAMRQGPTRFATTMVAGFSIALVVPVFFQLAGPHSEFLEKWYVVIVHARVFGVPQLIIAQYIGFFADHPVTLWSHVSGLNAIIHYPYEIDVPRTVGEFYYGSPVGLNGGLWVQDGIGAAGLTGVLLISLICSFVFWVFDSMAATVPLTISAPALGFVAVWFTNAPLGTALLSGGMALLALLLWLFPAAEKRR